MRGELFTYLKFDGLIFSFTVRVIKDLDAQVYTIKFINTTRPTLDAENE